MDYLAEVEERIKHTIEQIEEEMDDTHVRENTETNAKDRDTKLGVE
jgi:hypothetical protein